MKSPNAWAEKDQAVEEWADRRFFRPAGMAVVRLVAESRVTPDQVTVAALLVGLVGGHLFLYDSTALNLLGLGLLVGSDVLDSSDGQLARLRGTSTRFGRMLDGSADNLRFVNLYVHLILRLLHGAAGWPAVAAAALAGLSHSYQSAVADFVRQAFMFVAKGGGELDLPGRAPAARSAWQRLLARLYAGYVRRQARLFPSTVTLALRLRDHTELEGPAALYAAQAATQLRRCAWIGQNVRFLILLSAVLAGPMPFFALTVLLNVPMIWIILGQERAARAALSALPALQEVPTHVRVA